jgi:hypothetical protein
MAASTAACAADIYFWTDENGRTHLGDSVPARHRKSALRIDSTQFELSPEQQREAAARRAALEKKAREAGTPATAASAAVGPPAGAAPLSAVSPRPGPTLAGEKSDCDALHREYLESLECFAPYMNANGTVKPGAFTACKSVVNPTLKCGSPKAY